MTIKIQKGRILVYRVFDVGEEIDLEKSEKLILENPTARSRFRLKKMNQNAVMVSSEPLSVLLPKAHFQINSDVLSDVDFELSAKIWEFGTISFTFEWSIPKGTSLLELKEFSRAISEIEALDDYAKSKAFELSHQIKDCMGKISQWEVYEDYLLYYFENIEHHDKDSDASTLLTPHEIADLILLEDQTNFGPISSNMAQKIYDSKLQYYKSDLAVIDWNSGIIIEPSGSMDIPDVIEFALNQLLEMRYYDDLLDKKLREIYSAIELKEMNIFSGRYTDLALDAGQKYIEIAEIVESVENSLKVIGDLYLSSVFRLTSSKFRFTDWQLSIDNKLENLAEICKLLLDNINSRRSHVMELIIIVLIAIELIPFIKEAIPYIVK